MFRKVQLMFFNYLIFSFITYKCVGVIISDNQDLVIL